MRDCQTLREELRAYLDGELSPVQRLAVRLHLARCAACREEMREMEQISNDLRAGDAGTLDPALRAKILASIPTEAPPAPETPAEPVVPKWRRKPFLLWRATAAAVLAWFVIYPLTQGWTPLAERSISLAPGGASASKAARPAIAEHRLASPPMETAKTATKMPTFASKGAVENAAGAPSAPTVVAAPTAVDNDSFSDGHLKERMRQSKSIAAGEAANAPDLVSSERQVHKQADITVEVTNVEEKTEEVEQMVKTVGGFVANNQLSTGEDNLKAASLTTRVPVGQFEMILSKLGKLGEVKAKNVTGEYITEQMSDQEQLTHTLSDEVRTTEARLRDKRHQTQTWEDAENLRQLRVRAAQAQGRLQLLKKLSALATITVQLQEKPKPTIQSGGGFLDEMGDTGRAAVHSFLQAARLPILMLIWLLAYAPIWILLAIAYRYAVRT